LSRPGTVIYNYINLKNISSLDNNDVYGKLVFKVDHNICYYEHSYIRNKYIYYDYKNNIIQRANLQHYKYRLKLLKEIIIDKNFFSKKEIKDFFIKTFGNIEYVLIKDEDKEDIINNYIKRYKINTEVDINEIINLDRQISSALSYVNKMRERKFDLHNL